jgi:hypothetical protein
MKQRAIENLSSSDYLDRCDAIEYLSKYINDKEVASKLLTMFEDSNYIVRCEAYDAFYGYTDTDITQVLVKKLKRERSKCARMYLCSTLCSIIKLKGCDDNIKEEILACADKEKSLNVLLAFWCILYVIKKDIQYIYKVLDCFNNSDYHIRCNVVNLLYDVIDDKNIDVIVKNCKKQLGQEDSRAVAGTIESFIDMMKTEGRI